MLPRQPLPQSIVTSPQGPCNMALSKESVSKILSIPVSMVSNCNVNLHDKLVLSSSSIVTSGFMTFTKSLGLFPLKGISWKVLSRWPLTMTSFSWNFGCNVILLSVLNETISTKVVLRKQLVSDIFRLSRVCHMHSLPHYLWGLNLMRFIWQIWFMMIMEAHVENIVNL